MGALRDVQVVGLEESRSWIHQAVKRGVGEQVVVDDVEALSRRGPGLILMVCFSILQVQVYSALNQDAAFMAVCSAEASSSAS